MNQFKVNGYNSLMVSLCCVQSTNEPVKSIGMNLSSDFRRKGSKVFKDLCQTSSLRPCKVDSLFLIRILIRAGSHYNIIMFIKFFSSSFTTQNKNLYQYAQAINSFTQLNSINYVK